MEVYTEAEFGSMWQTSDNKSFSLSRQSRIYLRYTDSLPILPFLWLHDTPLPVKSQVRKQTQLGTELFENGMPQLRSWGWQNGLLAQFMTKCQWVHMAPAPGSVTGKWGHSLQQCIAAFVRAGPQRIRRNLYRSLFGALWDR